MLKPSDDKAAPCPLRGIRAESLGERLAGLFFTGPHQFAIAFEFRRQPFARLLSYKKVQKGTTDIAARLRGEGGAKTSLQNAPSERAPCLGKNERGARVR